MKMVKEGQIYRHFKGDLVKVLTVALDSETLEELVIYEHKDKIWARSLKMFISKVDKQKYPNIDQKYRFEEIDE